MQITVLEVLEVILQCCQKSPQEDMQILEDVEQVYYALLMLCIELFTYGPQVCGCNREVVVYKCLPLYHKGRQFVPFYGGFLLLRVSIIGGSTYCSY